MSYLDCLMKIEKGDVLDMNEYSVYVMEAPKMTANGTLYVMAKEPGDHDDDWFHQGLTDPNGRLNAFIRKIIKAKR